ncbi:hypothetical protein ACFQVC_27960 [Streptomyces monticola]|uniref:Uncharacterized protein n=1 Tax=Streptomyces monticola TaxID=2666263 RepID=A0ABW2JQ38_9ACTN
MTMEPLPEFQIVQVDLLGTDLLAIVGRCLVALRFGARFHCTSRQAAPSNGP